MRTPSRTALRTLAALSLTMICGACARSELPPVTVVAQPDLPRPPSDFGVPVKVPPMHSGQDVRAANVEARGALDNANTKLMSDRAIYIAVCQGFSATPCHP